MKYRLKNSEMEDRILKKFLILSNDATISFIFDNLVQLFPGVGARKVWSFKRLFIYDR